MYDSDYALVYEPAVLGNGVFIGPAVVLTNDSYPRAVTPDGEPKSAAEWQPVGVTVGDGAAIGARAVCPAPVAIGEWALIAAGAVVTRDVPAQPLVASMPAKQFGLVERSGLQMSEREHRIWVCRSSGERYHENQGTLSPADE